MSFYFLFTDTSREPRAGEEHGRGYYFVSREEMERDIRAGKFIEYGEHGGNLYGTKIDTIREVMRSGKMCFLDVNPTVNSHLPIMLCGVVWCGIVLCFVLRCVVCCVVL